MLDDRLKERLHETHERMRADGELLSIQSLDECYSLFRSRFGPDVLRRLDGERLLNVLHANGRDSLRYWLEFKNDEEFPANFGGIAGGSALKYGIYKRKETDTWMTGSPRKQEELSVGGAIAIARQHRDEMIAGAEALSGLGNEATDEEYAELQRSMDGVAPKVSNTAWGHKYFSLLFPEKLDAYHVEEYGKFHLTKLLQRPPEGKGRYLAAGVFVRLSREMGWPVHHLGAVCHRLNGHPYRVWRVLADIGLQTSWEFMRDQECVAIGWPLVGDLSGIERNRQSKTQIVGALTERYDMTASGVAARRAGEILDFACDMKEGDLVLAGTGLRMRGIGRLVDDRYHFDSKINPDAPHQRKVCWKWTGNFLLPTREGWFRAVWRLRKIDNLLEVERRLTNGPPVPPDPRPVRNPSPVSLSGTPGRVQSILERKGQVILYGPPGTGKTYWARRAGLDLAALDAFQKRFEDLDESQRAKVEGSGAQRGVFRMCTFHPAYGYEDFIEGYRPMEAAGGALLFRLADGIFKRICADAAREPRRRFYLLVDEINRGDIPRIFGELLTLLERDKRGQTVHLPVSGETFSVPENVHLIGTMNTADRSMALLDTALRRRFGFLELMPDTKELGDAVVAGSIPLAAWLTALNERILEHIGRDARNLQIGHAYLMPGGRPVTDFGAFVRVFGEDIVPLLEEYCYEDYAALARILGRGLVDEAGQRFRSELLEPDRREDFIQAVLEPSPELATAPQIVAQPEDESEEPEEPDEDEGGKADNE